MTMRIARAFITVLLPLVVGGAAAQGFKFSNPDNTQQAEQAARDDRIAWELSTPCRADLKGKKIMVIIGEKQDNGIINAQQQNYGRHFQAINVRLRSLGLRTYTPEEIRAQIAQAEIDAYFKNNPDAALSAAKRLGAAFVLRGLITSEASRNPMIPVNQVTVSMGFTLIGSNGKIVSNVAANSSSYAGANVGQMALTLVNEQADEVVAQLYGDYCRNAGLGSPPPKAKK